MTLYIFVPLLSTLYFIIHYYIIFHYVYSFDSFGAVGLTCAVDQTSLTANTPPDLVAAGFCCSHPVARETGCQNDVAGGSICYAQCKFLPIPAPLIPPGAAAAEAHRAMSAQNGVNSYYPPPGYFGGGNPYYNLPNYAGVNPYYPPFTGNVNPYYPPPNLVAGPGPVVNPTTTGWALDSCGFYKYS